MCGPLGPLRNVEPPDRSAWVSEACACLDPAVAHGPLLGTDGRRGHRLALLGIICQPLRAHWEQPSRRALLQQLQGMRGPKDGTVASSGHSFIVTARSWPQCWQVTNEPRMPCQRMLPSVIGRIGSSSQTAPKAAYDCGASVGSHSIFRSQPQARIPAPPGAHLALLGQMRKTFHDHAANAAGRIADNAAVRIAVGQPGEGTGSVQPYLRPTQRYDRDVAPIDITGLAQPSSVLICTKVDILLVPLSPFMFDREKPRHSSVLPDSRRVHQVGSYQGTPVVVPTYSRPT